MILEDVLSTITNNLAVGKFNVRVKRYNKLTLAVLEKLKEYKYVKDFRVENNELIIELSENINKVLAIKPRFFVGYRDLEKYEKRYLPAYGFGYLIISTSKGIKTNEECKKEKIGGVLLAYVY